MNHYLLKSLVAMVVAFVLLYYGIAWTVLRCSHDAEHADYEITLQDRDMTHRGFHHASVDTANPDLECVGPNFHTEAMAEASSPPQLDRLTPNITPHINDFLTLRTETGDTVTDTSLRAVFETSSSLAFLIGLPSYLFLSILRI